MENAKEIWRPAVGFEGFVEVSDRGRVRTVDNVRFGRRAGRANRQFRPGKVLNQFPHTSGYKIVVFVIGGKRNQVYVHRLVATAFVDGNASLSVNHIDGNKSNNYSANLEWCSLAENTRKQWADGLCDNHGERNGQAKLNTAQIVAIKRLLAAGASQTDIAIAVDVTPSCISFIANGKRWASVAAA